MFKLAKTVSLLALVLATGSTGSDRVAHAQTSPPIAPGTAANAKPGKAPKSPTKTATKAATKTAIKTATKSATKTTDAAEVAGGTAPRQVAVAVNDGKDVALSSPPPASSPLADLKKSNDQLDKLLKKKYPSWSPEGEGQKAAVQKLVGGFLDYRELARRSLAKHWDKLQPAQRQDFVSTLRELVERSYLKQISGDPNYNIKYEKETKDGSEATVEATLNTMARGKKIKIALVYKLVYKDHWLVYDVITDEQSMLENYRAEFNKIINKDGFDTLLKRMKKKLEEKDE